MRFSQKIHRHTPSLRGAYRMHLYCRRFFRRNCGGTQGWDAPTRGFVCMRCCCEGITRTPSCKLVNIFRETEIVRNGHIQCAEKQSMKVQPQRKMRKKPSRDYLSERIPHQTGQCTMYVAFCSVAPTPSDGMYDFCIVGAGDATRYCTLTQGYPAFSCPVCMHAFVLPRESFACS